MTAALFFFAVSVVLAAVAISSLLRRHSDEQPGTWESAASIAVLAFALAIAISWALSWLSLLARGPLLVSAGSIAIPSIVFLYRQRARFVTAARGVSGGAQILLLVPLIVWIGFVLWRGAIVPVLNHDALAYHLPKAVMLARAHHYDFFNAPDARIPTSPPNYEMLLADALLLSGSDDLTEWIGTAAYLALLLLGAALVERWWGSGLHIIVTVLLVAAVPVILLHAGAHKNDLLANVFYFGALLWGARWLVTQETAPLVLTLISLACAGGTKLQGAFVAAALVLVFVRLAVKRRIRITRRELLMAALALPAALFLFGGWAYVANLLHTGQAALPASSSSDAGYGDWRNLWEVPLLILLRPFDNGVRDMLVPWRGERWFWPRHELYFSDFGILITILVIALPFAVVRYARRWGSPSAQRERVVGSVAAGVAFLLMLPIRIRPLGYFAGFPRYFAFVAVFVLAWTIAPLVKEMRPVIARAIAATAAVIMLVTAVSYALFDSFQPFGYVLLIAKYPRIRQPFFAGYRAATIADRIAGPTDTIAIDSGFDSWIHPLYGRTLQRKVVLLEPGRPIPPEAKWVLVDRAWNIIWGHPQFRHTGQHRQYLGRGTATADDTAVLRMLLNQRDRWELVYYFRSHNQAVFKRRGL